MLKTKGCCLFPFAGAHQHHCPAAPARFLHDFVFFRTLNDVCVLQGSSFGAGAEEHFDVIVVGAGHAGCEAATAAANMGAQTMLLTLNLDRIAWQPCNPAVGGPAKSQLVHEIDALGGIIGKMADKCYVQKKTLNLSKEHLLFTFPSVLGGM